jgi:hypothetical protein
MIDGLSALFLGCFVFGFVAALISFVLGSFDGVDIGGLHIGFGGAEHGSMHHGGFDGGHADGAAGHHGDVHGDGAPSVLNPTTALTFLTWFGGAGFVLRNYYGLVAWLSLALAALVGLVGAAIVCLFLLKVLWPRQAIMRKADYDPVGSLGRVSSPIRADGVGEVTYMRAGTRRSAGARSLDGQALERGTEVVIARYEKGLAYVQRWEDVLGRDRRATAAEGNQSSV